MRRKCAAARRRTLQQVAAAFIAQNFDLPAAEYPLAQDTKTFIVKRRPGSKFIACPQDLEAFFGCEISLYNTTKENQLLAPTIRRYSDRLVSENLIAIQKRRPAFV